MVFPVYRIGLGNGHAHIPGFGGLEPILIVPVCIHLPLDKSEFGHTHPIGAVLGYFEISGFQAVAIRPVAVAYADAADGFHRPEIDREINGHFSVVGIGYRRRIIGSVPETVDGKTVDNPPQGRNLFAGAADRTLIIPTVYRPVITVQRFVHVEIVGSGRIMEQQALLVRIDRKPVDNQTHRNGARRPVPSRRVDAQGRRDAGLTALQDERALGDRSKTRGRQPERGVVRRVIPVDRILRHIQPDHNIFLERPCHRNGEFLLVGRHPIVHDKLRIRLIERQQHLFQHIGKDQNGVMLAIYVAVGNKLQRNHIIVQPLALLQGEQRRRIGECHIEVARAVVACQGDGIRVHLIIILRKQFVVGAVGPVIVGQSLFRQPDGCRNGLVEISGAEYPDRRFGAFVDSVERFGNLQSVVDDVDCGIGQVGVAFILARHGQHPQSSEYGGNIFELFHDKMLVL